MKRATRHTYSLMMALAPLPLLGLLALATGTTQAQDTPPTISAPKLYNPAFGDPLAPPPAPPAAPDPLAEIYGMQPAKPARPNSHTPDFLRNHGPLARVDDSACTSCHQPQECLDCHNGALKPALTLHPPGYLAYHSLEARKDAQSCASCHSPQVFCRDCHDLTRAGTTGAARPVAGLRIHPPSWLGQVPGPQHGPEARRNLTACASCHSEQDCVRCHTNINPHPPSYTSTCQEALRRNPRTCTQCHVDMARIQAICR